MNHTLSSRSAHKGAILGYLTGWIVILGLLAVVLFAPGAGTTQKDFGALPPQANLASK